MSLENSLLKSLFPYTAKRQSRPAETIFDFDVNANIPLGHDLPENGGITGNMPYHGNESMSVEEVAAPDFTDDRVSIEQGGASTQPFIPTQQELTPDTSGMSSLINNPTIDLDRPEFELPYPQPTSMYEQTQNALAKGQYDAQNPRNRDKGFKGALKEALQNFAFGLSHAQPGMGFWESMALGGTGLGAGLVDRSSNERREAMRNLPMLQQNAKIASDEMDAVQNRKYRGKQMEKIDLEEANRVRDDAARAEKDQREYDLKIKMADWKIADRQTYWEWEKVKEQAKREGKQKDYELAVRKQDEIERNNQVKTDQTERKGMPKNNVPLPASSYVPPRTGKTTEAAARAYLGKKLKGDALENAIKTARANGEIQ